MKKHVYQDEWYPVYGLSDSDRHVRIELTEEEFERYKKAEDEFIKVQVMLRAKYKKAGGK